MQNLRSFYANGRLVTVPEDEMDEFMASMQERGETPDEVETFEDENGTPLLVPMSERDEFMETMGAQNRPIRNMRTVLMDDGKTLNLGEEDIRQFVQARRQGMPMSRGLLANTGVPDWYGKGREDREALADALGGIYFPEEQKTPENMGLVGFDPTNTEGFIPPEDVLKDEPGGMLDYMKTAKEAQYGRDLNALEATAANVPFVGSVMDSNEARQESVEKRLYSGDFRDSLEASKLALSIGIPQEEVRRINAEANGDMDAMRQGFSDLVSNQLAQRIVTRQKKGERLNEFDLNVLQKAGVGAAGLVKTVTEMSNPVSAAATIGPSMMNRAAGMADGEWTVGPDGKPVEVMAGDDGDTAMLKGLGGAVAERAIWMNPWMSKWAGAVAKKAGGSMVANNAAQVVDMTLKNDLTDLADNVIGLDKSQIDKSKTVAEWAKEHFLPQNLAKDIIHSAVAHVGMKGMRLVTKSGREALANEIGAEIKRRGALEERRMAQERAAEADAQELKDAKREAQKAAYDASMSDEAKFALEQEIDAQVAAGVIPESAKENIRQRVIAKVENPRSLDDADLREGALMKAIGDYQTPSRVTSPAHERRQTEAKMRENEFLTRRGEEMAENIVNPPAERTPNDAEAVAAERTSREEELNRVFAEQYDAWKAERDAAGKEGRSFTKPEPTRESVARQMGLDLGDARTSKAENDAARVEKEGKAAYDAYEADQQKTAEERELADFAKGEADAVAAKRARQADLEAAFADWTEADAKVADAVKTQKSGGAVKNVEAMKRGAEEAKQRALTRLQKMETADLEDQIGVLEAIENPPKKIQNQLQAMKDELVRRANGGEDVKFGEEPAKTDTETQKLTDEVSKNDGEAKKSDNAKIDAKAEYPVGTKLTRDDGTEYVRIEGTITDIDGSVSPAWREVSGAKRKTVQENVFYSTNGGETKPSTSAQKLSKADTDAAFRAWAVDRDGKPLEFATKADEQASRETFDMLVKMGKVDAQTGKAIEPKYGEVKEPIATESDIVSQPPTAASPAKEVQPPAPTAAKSAGKSADKNILYWVDGKPVSGKVKKSVTIASRGGNEITADVFENGDVVVHGASGSDISFKSGTSVEKIARAMANGTYYPENSKGGKWRERYDEAVSGLSSSSDVPNNHVNADSRSSGDNAAVTSAQKLLKEKFYADEKTLARQLAALPAQAPKELRTAYETAIAEAKRRNAETRQIAEETVSMRSNDPKRRSRAAVVEWAKNSGRQVINGMVTPDAMREYDAQMAQKTAKAVKRMFPDMKIDYYDKDPGLGGEGKVIEMRNKHGDTLGWFRPSDKSVTLLPGSDAETVAHEIGWHAVRDWAQRENPKLFAKMREVEDNVDPALRAKVLHIYRSATGYTRDNLLNEFGAWTFMGRGGKALEEIVSSREGAKWYAKMLNAAKDLYKDYASKHGGNRVDLSEIDGMNGEQLMDFMAKQMAEGKTFGEIGAPKPSGKSISTKEGAIERYKRIHYDVGSVFRAIGKEIEKNGGGAKNAATEVDEAYALKPGEQEAVGIRLKTKSRELKELYAKHGVSHEDFSYYMACKAAAGRDAKVDERNIKELQSEAVANVRREWGSERINNDPSGFKDACEQAKDDVRASYESSNGSNINPREAAKTIAEWESGDMAAKTAELRKAWREIIDNTLQMQKDAGLISEKQYNEWKEQEIDYVPFKSPIDETTGEYVGRGTTNFLRPEHMTAKGRKTAAGDVLSHAMVDWQVTENRAIENRLREKLAKLVEAHPELGTVEKISRNEVTEKKTSDTMKDGKIVIDDGGDPNVVIFKRGGESYAIRLNGERGSAMAAAITGRNLSSKLANAGVTMPKWLPGVGGKKLTVRGLTRAWAATATSLSPTFAIRNTIKDNIELANIVYTEMGPVKGTKFAANYVKNRELNHLAIMKFITTGKIDAATASGKVLQDFINDGGMIGGLSREGYADIAKNFSAGEISKMMKSGDNLALAAGKHAIRSVKYLTEWSELATRVNAYAAAKAVGMNGREAALWSRRAVTDFNRRGEWTGTTNVLRMFSNSTLGATARAFKSFGTSKWGVATAGCLIAKGYLMAMLEEYMNDENDKKAKAEGTASGKDVTEFDRVNSFALVRDGDKEYRIPQHESPFAVLSYFGDCIRRVQTGRMTVKQMAKEMGLETATLATHLTGWGDINFDNQEGSVIGAIKAAASSGIPSILQPAMEILTNVDYAGRQVYNEGFPGDNTPRSEKGRKNTPEFYKMIARKLNELSGGNAGRKGVLDFNPEMVQKMLEGAGKNMAKDVVTAYMTISSALNGEMPKLDVKNTFVKRDFMRTVSDSTSRFFNVKREAKKDVDEWNAMNDSWSLDERKKYLADHPWCSKLTQKRLNILVNGSKEHGFRGINALRHLIDGKTAEGKPRKSQPTDEQIEAWTKELRRKQAKYIELAGGDR